MNLRFRLNCWVAGWLVWGGALMAAVAQPLFFDDFSGPALNHVWQARLPTNAYSGSFPFGSAQMATYLGAAHYSFATLDRSTVLHLNESMDSLHRVGWSTATHFISSDFYYDVRFNTLVQSPATSIDGFIEIWLMDAANPENYDIVSPFGGSYDGAESFFVGSSLDGNYTETPFTYQNNTWYHLVLQSAPGQNIRASIYDDHGTELIGRTLNHSGAAFPAGFKLGLSQLIGFAQGVYPVNVAVDYARLTGTVTRPTAPVITGQPASQSVAAGGMAAFTVAVTSTAPLTYQWYFSGTHPVPGGTQPTLTLTNVQAAEAGRYSVVVSNPYGRTTSATATLALQAPLPTAFFDDFNGPVLNPIWQTNLPSNAYSGSFPFGSAQTAAYLGAPQYGFETLGASTVLRLTNSIDSLQRVGWGTSSNFAGGNFYYDVRFNSLVQSPTTSIDGFIEIWLIDAANPSNYDLVSPFGGSYDGAESFFVGSSVDGNYTETPFSYQNNTWYHLVLQSAPGQNIRASIFDDAGTELIGSTLNHGGAAFPAGFKLGLSQLIGFAQGVYPVDVAVDYVRLSGGLAPVITRQPANQAIAAGGTANFSVTADGVMPFSYQWQFNGTSLPVATNATLTLTNVLLRQAGDYAVRVTNPYGAAQSATALLTVRSLSPRAASVPRVTVPAPALSLRRADVSLVIQWPTNATGVVLETTATLAPADWVPVTNTPVLNGAQWELQIATTNSSQFFQLRSAEN